MSFIVQCLCVCPAAPQPHLPSLLITAHYGEVKEINQKALSQSLSHYGFACRPASPAQSETGPWLCPHHSEGHRAARRLETEPSPSFQFRSLFLQAPSLRGPVNWSPNITSSITSSWMLLAGAISPFVRATEPSPWPCRIQIHLILPQELVPHSSHPSLGCLAWCQAHSQCAKHMLDKWACEYLSK